jgi:NADPH:quinone reductase-like Zn-dependent oxidoreductase
VPRYEEDAPELAMALNIVLVEAVVTSVNPIGCKIRSGA